MILLEAKKKGVFKERVSQLPVKSRYDCSKPNNLHKISFQFILILFAWQLKGL